MKLCSDEELSSSLLLCVDNHEIYFEKINFSKFRVNEISVIRINDKDLQSFFTHNVDAELRNVDFEAK